MSKKYMLISMIQGLCIAFFILFIPDYVNNDTILNFVKVILPLNGIIILNRWLANEEY